jgi:hypothetical protein
MTIRSGSERAISRPHPSPRRRPLSTVVVSESSVVRIYSRGNLITEILPELWLLHRYMPHIARPSLSGDQEHDLAIVSETR